MLVNAQAHAQTAVVKARLTRADMVGIPAGDVVLDAYFTRTFHVTTTLYGAISDRTIRDVINSAQPYANRDYYLLIDSSQGVARIVDSSLASGGLCISAETLRTYLNDAAVRDLLRQHPCAE